MPPEPPPRRRSRTEDDGAACAGMQASAATANEGAVASAAPEAEAACTPPAAARSVRELRQVSDPQPLVVGAAPEPSLLSTVDGATHAIASASAKAWERATGTVLGLVSPAAKLRADAQTPPQSHPRATRTPGAKASPGLWV
eukprot:4142223-Prymnesium_polylepis.1